MRRILLLLVLVLLSCFVAPAGAGTVTWLGGNDVEIAFGSGGSTSLGIDFNRTWTWKLCEPGQANCSAPLSFNRTWDDRGTTLTINRGDFPSYGIDAEELSEIETRIGNFETYRVYEGFGSSLPGSLIQDSHIKVRDFNIDRFEWTFTMNFSSYTMVGHLYGSGTVVPEPCASALFLPLLLVGIGNLRKIR
jgi:hypothetical protein